MDDQTVTQAMDVTVALFGPQAQHAGRRAVRVTVDRDATVAGVRAALAAAELALVTSLPASRFAVNGEYAGEDHPVRAGDEVALIGMVCGG